MVVLTEPLNIRVASQTLYKYQRAGTSGPAGEKGVSFSRLYMSLAVRRCSASKAAKLCLIATPLPPPSQIGSS